MKQNVYLLLVLCQVAIGTVHAQNADQRYFNQLALQHNYQAASFVVDTSLPSSAIKRAFLLWSKNYSTDTLRRFLSLDEFDANGNFISEHVNRHGNVPGRALIPKKIIRARSFNGYYLLGYVVSSNNKIDTFKVYSTPVILKISNNLSALWVRKINVAAINPNASNALIEYNDIIETRNGQLILAGRYAPNFSGQQIKVLVTRLSNLGNLVWNNYYNNYPACNAVAMSVAEASDESICLTGHIDRCTSPAFAGTRELLFMHIQSTGTPIPADVKKFGSTGAFSGDKIVRYTNAVGADRFFISGYTEQPAAAGVPPTNRQILLVDITQTANIIRMFHVGDTGTEIANDLIFKNIDGKDHYLYLTGYTTSYHQTEPYYLQLKYNISSNTMGLVEFSTFPHAVPDSFSRSGVEIKKAGKNRFAILANTFYKSNLPVLNPRGFTNVLVRDLTDTSKDCINRHGPTITRIELQPITVATYPFNPGFKVYVENYSPFEKVYTNLECGKFFIDAPAATTGTTNPDEVLSIAPSNLVNVQDQEKTAVSSLTHFYPNPVKDELFIDYKNARDEQVQVKIYSVNMQLVGEYHYAGKSRIIVPFGRLTNGIYFVRMETKSEKQSFKIRKE